MDEAITWLNVAITDSHTSNQKDMAFIVKSLQEALPAIAAARTGGPIIQNGFLQQQTRHRQPSIKDEELSSFSGDQLTPNSNESANRQSRGENKIGDIAINQPLFDQIYVRRS